MAFEGLIITDDLEMGAIAGHWTVADGAAAALGAGADILLICKDQTNVVESINLIKRKFSLEEISHERLDQSFERIMKARRKFLGHNEKISLSDVKAYFRL